MQRCLCLSGDERLKLEQLSAFRRREVGYYGRDIHIFDVRLSESGVALCNSSGVYINVRYQTRCPMDELLESQASAEIHRLLTEHQRYSLRLDELQNKPYLSSDEQLEEVRLKKLKLHAKDLIAAIEHHAAIVVSA